MSAKEAVPLIALGVATGGVGFAAAGAMGASTLAAASAGLLAGSAVLQGVAGASAAKAQENEAKLRRQAEATQKAANDLARERKVRSTLSAQRAAFAAGGVDFSSGSAAGIAQQTQADAALEAQQEAVASGVRQSIFGLNAKSAKTAGTFSLVGGLFNAGGSIVSQASRNQKRGGSDE